MMRAPEAGSTCASSRCSRSGPPPRRETIEAVAQRLIGARARKQAPNQSPVVEPGAADQDRQPPARVHVANDGAASRANCAAV
jgi:hypothetical protein